MFGRSWNARVPSPADLHSLGRERDGEPTEEGGETGALVAGSEVPKRDGFSQG